MTKKLYRCCLRVQQKPFTGYPEKLIKLLVKKYSLKKNLKF